MSTSNEVWGRRLKDARIAAGLSQKQLGIAAGLDPFVSSARINRYELGVHKADYKIAQLLAKTLDIPTAYLYAEDDDLADLILMYHRLSSAKRRNLIKAAKEAVGGARGKPND